MLDETAMLQGVRVTLKHQDGTRKVIHLPLNATTRKHPHLYAMIGIALDYLGFDNPEPWELVDWDHDPDYEYEE